MKMMEDIIKKDMEESIAIKKQLLKIKTNIIRKVAEEIIKAYNNGNKVVWFGNGGSAADAQHLSAELVGKFYDKREALESIALTTNTSILTSVANDFDFSKVFSRQVEALVKKGDVAIGISTSGTSPNVIQGIEEAKKRGATTVIFTGKINEKKINKNIDYIIAVPSKDTPRIQESHIMIGHIICHLVEKELFGK